MNLVRETERGLGVPLLQRSSPSNIAEYPEGAAYNASGTAKFNDPSNLGLSGYLDQTSQPKVYRQTAESKILVPAEMIAAGDIEPGSPGGTFFWSSGHFDLLSTDHSYWPGKSHSGQANMLFCDGHIESARQTKWLSATTAALSRWNNDHEPHPETWIRP